MIPDKPSALAKNYNINRLAWFHPIIISSFVKSLGPQNVMNMK